MRALTTAFLMLYATAGLAQPPKVEITGRIGLGSLRIFGSDYVDNAVSLGAGLEVRPHSRLGLEFQFDRLLGLVPRSVPCALTVPCTGSAVEGTRTTDHFAGNVILYFGGSRGIEPYIVAGAGVRRSVQAHAITIEGPTSAQIVQQPDETDHGLSLGGGGGVRIPVGRFSLRPEVRFYSATILSRSNLSVIQAGVLVGYYW